ncbi:hypothetical protein JCM16303_006166 [Sporobolomyces ruberrimus]
MAPGTTGAAKTAAGGSSVRGRTKHEQDQLQRKTVYRPVLDNPLTVAWPSLPASVRKSILDQLLPILTAPQGTENKAVSEWRMEEHAARRGRQVGKGKRSAKEKGKETVKKGKRKRAKVATESKEQGEGTGDTAEVKEPPTKKVKSSKTSEKPKPSEASSSTSTSLQLDQPLPPTPTTPKPLRVPAPRPPILDYLCLGINEVTKALETRIRWGRWELGDPRALPGYSQLVSPPPTSTLIPTAPEDPKGKGRKRLRKKPNPTSFTPRTAQNLDSIDYSPFPEYAFVGEKARRPSREEVPEYCLTPTKDHPSKRLLVNSESFRIRRAVKKEKVANEKIEIEEESGKEDDKTDGKKGKKAERKKTVETKRAVLEKSRVEEAKPAMDTEVIVGAKEDGQGGREEDGDDDEAPTVPLIDLVFVCKPDINPPSLVAHLPGMIAAANGVQSALETVLKADATIEAQDKKVEKGKGEGMEIDDEEEKAERPDFGQVRIVPLDQGAERILADALGLRRVAAIGISSSAPGASELLELVSKHLEPPSAPWLTPHLLHPPTSSSRSQRPSSYVETHIKHLKTTAPLNPRAKHQEKKVVRKGKKEERKRKSREGQKGQEGRVYEAQDDDNGQD